MTEPEDAPPEEAGELTAEEIREWWAAYREQRCPWCGGLHVRACPRVKSMRFDNAGEKVLEVAFWPDGKWLDSFIDWPEDMPEEST
ncbi:hypothetical protein [Streptomyces sp. NPDC093261]|uniref:hypothetical protein n=1 Tax=Streptomyces sp. NPDC093261 TaxID=3366037 RepID=UPI00382BB58C